MSEELKEVRARLALLRDEEADIRYDLDKLAVRGADASLRLHHNVNLNRIEKEIDELELRERGLVDREAVQDAAVAQEQARLLAEEKGFWFRRYFVSIAIAHAAAFAAVASHLMDHDADPLARQNAVPCLALFALGLVLAGVVPAFLAEQKAKTARALASISAALFVLGLMGAVWGAYVLAWPEAYGPLDLLGSFPRPHPR